MGGLAAVRRAARAASGGPRTETALAVAWDSDTRAIWVDADGDRRLTRLEGHELKAGAALEIPVRIAAAKLAPIRRTILVGALACWAAGRGTRCAAAWREARPGRQDDGDNSSGRER